MARELGLRRNHLYKWQLELETHGDATFPGKGGRAHSTDERPAYGGKMHASARSATFIKKPRCSLRGSHHEIPIHSGASVPASD